MLNKLCIENDLSIYDKGEKSFKGIIKSRNNKRKIRGEGHEDIDSLSVFLSGLDETIWPGLIIAKIENEKEVLDKGESIADDISVLFKILMPLYGLSIKYSSQGL